MSRCETFEYNFFLVGESLYEPFRGTFWGGQDFFDPLNCPERSEGQFVVLFDLGKKKNSKLSHACVPLTTELARTFEF